MYLLLSKSHPTGTLIMDGLPPIDVVKLKAQLQEDLDKCLAKVGASLDAAAPGRQRGDLAGRTA